MSKELLAAVLAKLDAMIAATPLPPAADDPDAVLDAFAVVARDRAALIDELAALAGPVSREPAVVERHALLSARDQTWMGALQRAQILVGERIGAVRRARAYAR